MDSQELADRALGAIEGSRDLILSVSHRIHDRPELGGEERFACGLLAESLESRGFAVERGYAGIPTAFLARRGNPSGTRIAFLAEYDALPGIGHACGHNIICSSALAAGIGLGEVASSAGGEAIVVGTPAEETNGAKVRMSELGCFDEFDAALMVHPNAGNYYMTESLAMDAIEVEFSGRSTHAAATPWEGLNALDAVILTFNGINALRQQTRPDARIHGIITDGGKAPNIIPEHAAARFYIRAKRRDYLDALVERFKDCARAAALATGTRLETRNYEASFDDMVNNLALALRFKDRMEGLPGSGRFGRSPDSFGSIDMGNVSHRIPAIHVLVDIANGAAITPHTPEFRDAASMPYADEAVIRAAKALALTGLDAMTDTQFLEATRAEFAASIGCRPARGNRSTHAQ
jgi:amidohydrolase